MATKPYTIPRANSPFSEGGGNPTREWYNYLLYVGNSSSGNADALLNDITIISEKLGSPDGTPENIPPLSEQTGRIVGQQSILSNGVLPGIVTLQLAGDEGSPGNTFYYGTSSEGTKGFYTIASAFLGSDGDITLAVGDDGVTTIDLADVDVGTGGALKKYGFDPKGRLSEEDDATTDDLPEGTTNLYFTNARAKAAAVADTINPVITDVAPSQHAVSVALDEKIDESEKGEPNGIATLDSNGKLDAGQLPDLAITQTFVVASQAAMLALDCQQGDVAVRTDLSESFILTADPPSTLANWQQLLTPTSPVTSVFGRTGSVTAATGDYTFSQISSTPTTLSGYGITDAVPSSRTISTGTGLSGGGDLSANRTVALENTTVSPGSYGDATHVATFTVDAQGRLTAAGTAAIPVSTGTVTSVGLTMPSQFTVSGSPVTSSGTLEATWNTQNANVVLAGPSSGSAAVPTFRALVAADYPDAVKKSTTHLDRGADGTDSVTTTAAAWSALPSGYARFMNSSIGISGGAPVNAYGMFFKVANRDTMGGWAGIWVGRPGADSYFGSTDTSSSFATWQKIWTQANDGPGSGLDADLLDGQEGTYYLNLANQTGTLAASNGGTGQSSYAVGDLLYASTTTALSKLADVASGNALISGGVGVAPSYGKIGLTTHVSGTLPIANGGTGQTTAAAAFDALSPTTTNQDLIVRGASSNGRLGVGANGTVLTVTDGIVGWAAPATSGTVTSVGLSLPTIFSVTGSPVTAAGTLTASLAAQNSNLVLAGPTSGSAAAPAFRSLVSADVPLPTDYISGLNLIWNSATSISVGTGSAVIPSTGKLEVVSSQLTLSSLSLSASTFYHVYLFDNAGTPAIECVTTAPVIYNGTAYQKTGDATRRYIGSVLTDASGNIYRFQHNINQILFVATTTGTPFRVLNNGMSTSRVSVSLTSLLPVTADVATFHLQNTSSTATAMLIDTPETGFTGITGIWSVGNGQTAFADVPVLTRTFIYIFSSAPTGSGGFVDIIGYKFNR